MLLSTKVKVVLSQHNSQSTVDVGFGVGWLLNIDRKLDDQTDYVGMDNGRVLSIAFATRTRTTSAGRAGYEFTERGIGRGLVKGDLVQHLLPVFPRINVAAGAAKKI